MTHSSNHRPTLLRILVSFFTFIFFTGPMITTVAAQPDLITPPPIESSRFLFGVVNDNGSHISDLWGRGVHLITFELQWKLYQPSPGIYDESYISHMKQLLTSLKRQGWTVQLIPGYQYVPQWVFDDYPDAYYVNQYGEAYSPDAVQSGDLRVINAPFNPQARALISAYLARIFQDFDQSNPDLRFNSVRVGGGPQGELRYPPPVWNGHNNSFWAFDSYAQNPPTSGIPEQVVGWRPGIDPNPGTEGRGQLLVNPGYERSEDGFRVFAWSPDEEVSASLDGVAKSGNFALQLETHSSNRIHQFLRVSPNAAYDLGGWLKSGDGGGQARIVVTQYDAFSNLLSGAPFTKLENGSTTWQERTGTINTTPDTQFLKFELDGDQPGVYFFDDVWLTASGDTNTQNRDIDVPLAFYNWYVESLTRYQSWQIDEIRRYFTGQLDLVYAGKGVSPNQVTDALNNDLRGDGWSETSSGLYSASDYPRHLAALPDAPLGAFTVYLTGIEVPPEDMVDDYSPYPGDWSAAHWLAYLARQHKLAIWGENSGENIYEEMELTADRMRRNYFFAMMWAFESELYSGNFAAAEEYESLILRYMNQRYVFLPQILLP